MARILPVLAALLFLIMGLRGCPETKATVIDEPDPAGFTYEEQELHEAERLARVLRALSDNAPGYAIMKINLVDGSIRMIGRWHRKLPGPLGACDDQDDCRNNAQDGCDSGCPGSGVGSGSDDCGEGPVTHVEADGDSCFARCADGEHVYLEFCLDPQSE